MKAREKEIFAIESQIASLESQIVSEFVEIGKTLISSGYSGGRSAEITAALERSSALSATVNQRKAEMKAVSERMEHLKTIADTLKANERKVKSVQSEIDSLHKEIGTAAFEAFKAKCKNKDKYREVFEDVLRVEEEVSKKQKEIEAVETEGKTKGFFGRVKDRANIYLIKAAIVKTEMGRGSALASVGSNILSSDFPSSVNDENLDKVLAVPLGHKRTIAEVTTSSESLRAQQATLQAEVSRLVGSDQNPVSKLKEWEKEVAAAEHEIASMFRSVGEQCYFQRLFDEIGSQELNTHASTIQRLQGDIASRRNQIDSIKAAIELDHAVAECEQLKNRKQAVIAEIEAKQKEIETIEEQIDGNVKRQAELRKKIGG
jgi:chromosome segregation ATPase